MHYSLGLIGHPVSHSLSPRLHKAALAYHGLQGDYALIDIAPDDLQARLPAIINNEGFLGLNVTIPHKQSVVPLMNTLDASARMIAAVNTISVADGVSHGSNTDLFGFVQSLHDNFPGDQLQGESAVVVGAGGAARACLFGLCELGIARIFLYARDPAKAGALRASIPPGEFKTEVSLLSSQAKEELAQCRLMVNATPLGQAHSELPDWYCQFLALMKPGAFVFDLVYSLHEDTPTVARAKSLGLKAGDGTAMLLYQAAQSFRIWTGLDVPLTCLMGALSR